MEELSVEGIHRGSADDLYIEKAIDYCSSTGIDLLVADLGTEQQSTGTGKSVYMGERARELNESLGKSMLVLHGTSCLTTEQMSSIANDGILRVNMWTRIAREAGMHASEQQVKRMADEPGRFETWEPRLYLRDATEKAADIMEEVLDILGYARLAE